MNHRSGAILVLALAIVHCGSSDDAAPPTSSGGTGGAATAGAAGASAGSSGASPDGALPCIPGAQVACACVGGGLGAQVCSPNGTGYGACICPDGSAGAGVGGVSGAGAGGTPAGAAGASGALSDAAVDSPGDTHLDSPGEPDAQFECPTPCAQSIDFPTSAPSGDPAPPNGVARACAVCPAGSTVNDSSSAEPYCVGCSLSTSNQSAPGADVCGIKSGGVFFCSAPPGADLGSCEIHFRCEATNWCTDLAIPCP